MCTVTKKIEITLYLKLIYLFFLVLRGQMQRIGTKSNYVSAANRFMEFRDNEANEREDFIKGSRKSCKQIVMFTPLRNDG